MLKIAALALSLALVGCAVEPVAIDVVDDPAPTPVVDEPCTAARCEAPPRGRAVVGDFVISEATFSGTVLGAATPDEAQVDIRGGAAVGGLELDLWMKVDGADGRLWVYSVSMTFAAADVGAIDDVDAADLIDVRVCSGVGAFDADAMGVVCTFPDAGAVVVDGGVVSFELAREAARTAIGGSFIVERAQ